MALLAFKRYLAMTKACARCILGSSVARDCYDGQIQVQAREGTWPCIHPRQGVKPQLLQGSSELLTLCQGDPDFSPLLSGDALFCRGFHTQVLHVWRLLAIGDVFKSGRELTFGTLVFKSFAPCQQLPTFYGYQGSELEDSRHHEKGTREHEFACLHTFNIVLRHQSLEWFLEGHLKVTFQTPRICSFICKEQLSIQGNPKNGILFKINETSKGYENEPRVRLDPCISYI